MASYRDLKVWQLAMELVKGVYLLASALPAEERFGLTSQMRRAAVSIPSNVAEGHARSSTREFLHHISFALGSLAELETQIELCKRLGYIDSEDSNNVEAQGDEVGRMLRGLQSKLLQGTHRVREEDNADYQTGP